MDQNIAYRFILNPLIMRPLHRAALIVAPRQSVRPFVRLVLPIFSKQKAVETSNLVETWHWTRETRLANLSYKGQRSRPFERKCKNRFSHTSSSNGYRFTSNQDENDQRPILYLSSNAFHQQKRFVLLIICGLIIIVRDGRMLQLHFGRKPTCFLAFWLRVLAGYLSGV